MLERRQQIFVDPESGKKWQMPIWRDWQVILVQWVFFAVSLVLVLIRLYVQRDVMRRRPWAEVCTVIALLLLLGNDICYTLEVAWHYFDYRPQYYLSDTYPEYIPSLKVIFVNGMGFFFVSLFFCKAALLCFYSDLAPKHIFPKLRILMKVTWFLIVGSILTQVLWGFFSCWPISMHWSIHKHCHRKNKNKVVNALHLLTDIIVYIIPFIILYYLKNLSRKQRTEAGLLFGLGFLNIMIAVACAICDIWIRNNSATGSAELGTFLFLNTAQQFTAMVIVTAPFVRKFIRTCDWHRAFQRAGRSGMETSGVDTIISPAARAAAEAKAAAVEDDMEANASSVSLVKANNAVHYEGYI